MSHHRFTRFAPSATGWLHLGHIFSALCTLAVTRSKDSRWLLRIEDHDRQRSKENYCQGILEDLRWLGMLPENSRVERQSLQQEHYQQAFQQLRKRGSVYPCQCSRQEILRRVDQTGKSELYYDGHCLHHPPDEGAAVAYRFITGTKQVTFHDQLLGLQKQTPAEQCGDFVILDRKENWTYHFACVVDDIRSNFNAIVRGKDILSSTSRQILLWQALSDKELPAYFHHPLLTDREGLKLAKSRGSSAIALRRKEAVKAETLFAETLAAAGFPCGEAAISLRAALDFISSELFKSAALDNL